MKKPNLFQRLRQRRAEEKEKRKIKEQNGTKARIKKGKKLFKPDEIEAARKKILVLAKLEAQKQSIRIILREINELKRKAGENESPETQANRLTQITLLRERIRLIKKGFQPVKGEFTKAVISKSTMVSHNLSARKALDAIGEFNPETRRYLRKQMEIIDNGAKKKDKISVHAAKNAAKEIFKKIGPVKAAKFIIYFNKAMLALTPMLKELAENYS